MRDLLRAIASFTIHPSEATLWREHSSHHYRITSSMARGASAFEAACSPEQLRERADALLAQAGKASRYWRDGLTFRGLTPLEQLEHLQHHGGGTPLIDLTPDPMVALWMACEDSRETEAPSPNDGLLIGFNLDDRWTDVSGAAAGFGELQDELAADGVIGWAVPPVINDRIVVQRSRFLVSRLESEGRWHEAISDVWLPDLPVGWTNGTAAQKADRLGRILDPTQGRPANLPVLAFAIPRVLKPTLTTILASHYGISRQTVYPDAFGGVAR